MAIGDMARVVVRSVTTAPFFECGFHYRALTAASDWRQQLVDEWADNLLDPWFHNISEDVTLDTLTCEDVVPGTGPTALWTGTTAWQGDYPGPALPPQVAGVISWRSALQGRANRGRTYVPGMPMAAVDPGSDDWNAIGQEHLEEFGEQQMTIYSRTTGGSSIAFFVVCSRQLNGVPRGPVGIQIDDFRIRFQVATQRRRVPH